jgi:hypothetical protein
MTVSRRRAASRVKQQPWPSWLARAPFFPSLSAFQEFSRLAPSPAAARGAQKGSIRDSRAKTPRARVRYALDVALARMAFEIAQGRVDLLSPYRDLCQLSRQFDELEEGVVGPLLLRKVSSHRPALSRDRLVVRQILVACYGALRAIGAPRAEAERDLIAFLNRSSVATLLGSGGALPRGVRGTTLTDWWKRHHADSDFLAPQFNDAIARRSSLIAMDVAAALLQNFFGRSGAKSPRA